MTESEPPGCPEPAWVSIRMICTRQARAIASSWVASGIELSSLRIRDLVDADPGNGHLRRVDDLVRGPHDRGPDVLGHADDVVEEGGDVVVDANGVRSEWRHDATAADDIRVADHRAGEIPRAWSVDRVRVPDATDVEPVAHRAQQLVVGDGLGALHHHVGGGDARRAVELPPTAGAEAEAVARDQRRRGRRAGGAELVAEGGNAQQP